jgi:hypothetical protein
MVGQENQKVNIMNFESGTKIYFQSKRNKLNKFPQGIESRIGLGVVPTAVREHLYLTIYTNL